MSKSKCKSKPGAKRARKRQTPSSIAIPTLSSKTGGNGDEASVSQADFGGDAEVEEPGSAAWLKALPTSDQRDLLVAFASAGGMDAVKELARSRWGVDLKADELLELVIAWGVRHQMQSATGKLIQVEGGGGPDQPPDEAWVDSWEKAGQFILEMRALAKSASGEFRQWNAFRLKKGVPAGGRGGKANGGAHGFADFTARLASMTPEDRETYRRQILEILGI